MQHKHKHHVRHYNLSLLVLREQMSPNTRGCSHSTMTAHCINYGIVLNSTGSDCLLQSPAKSPPIYMSMKKSLKRFVLWVLFICKMEKYTVCNAGAFC